MSRVFAFALTVMFMLTASARAQLTFSGPPVYLGASTSATFAPAPVFTITPLPGGMDLTGDYYITVPPGTSGGSMVQWAIDRPIASGLAPFNITVNYTGFVSLSGTFTSSNTNGFMQAAIYNSGALVAGTSTVVQFAGTGAFTPIALTNTTTVSTYTWAPGDTLRLLYSSNYSYNGAGGVYDVNFPATAIVSPVPEPTCMLALIGLPAIALRRRRDR
jgi:hypothetical protein